MASTHIFIGRHPISLSSIRTLFSIIPDTKGYIIGNVLSILSPKSFSPSSYTLALIITFSGSNSSSDSFLETSCTKSTDSALSLLSLLNFSVSKAPFTLPALSFISATLPLWTSTLLFSAVSPERLTVPFSLLLSFSIFSLLKASSLDLSVLNIFSFFPVGEKISISPNFTSSFTQEVAKNISLPIYTINPSISSNEYPVCSIFSRFSINLLTRFPDFTPMSETSIHFAPRSF